MYPTVDWQLIIMTSVSNNRTDSRIGLSCLPVHVMHVVPVGSIDGGMENGIINVANGLPDHYRVSVCIFEDTELFSQKIRRSDSLFFLLPKRDQGIDWHLVLRLAKVLKSAEVDLVHSHNWGTFLYSVLAAKLASIPIVHGDHGKSARELKGDSRVKRWVKSQLGGRVERIVAVSEPLAAEWLSLGVPSKRIQWILNGVDIDRFKPRDARVECRQKFGLPEDGLLIGSVGRLDELKNFGVLVEAFAEVAKKLPNSYLAIIGQGPQEQFLKDEVVRLGLSGRVSLLGHHADPENFLNALDIFVLPSKFEGMSNVVLEAMASGLAVVCADLPAHRKVFEPQVEGILVSPCTADVLGHSLLELGNDPQRRQRLGTAAREKVISRFSLQRMVDDYERVYAECARRRTNTNDTSVASVEARQ